jgi:hypothetical protein
MKKRSLHKTLLLLLLVLTPLWWLTMTEDGQRRSDAALLWLIGKEGIEVNLKALDPQLTEDELKQVYQDLPWNCAANRTGFGSYTCASEVGTFNGIPSREVRLFFADGRANALKLSYRDIYHKQLLEHLIRHLGQPKLPKPGTADAQAVLEWRTDYGHVILKQELLDDEEPAMLWLAGARPPSTD